MEETLEKLIQDHNGILTAKTARESGIDNKVLQRLALRGQLEHAERGIYLKPDVMPDAYLLAQYRCPRGIFAMETALFLHDLTDRTPIHLMMMLPSGASTRLLKEKESYEFFYCQEAVYRRGIITMRSPYGNDIRAYDRERTICDCIRKRERLDADLVLEAVKRYMKEKGNDYSKLLEYAEDFRIRDTVKLYMEVLNG